MGLDLTKKPPADEKLRLHVVRSLEIKDWYDNDCFGPKPSADLGSYVGKDFRRRLGRYVGAVKKLYFDLQVGSIIVVPGEGYFGEVLIGEITEKASAHSWTRVYGGEEFLTRKVKWVRSKQRGTFSEEVRERLSRPDPVMQLDRSLRHEIIRAGFDQYAFSDIYSARLNTEEDEFNTLNDFDIQAFLNYVTGILIAVEKGISRPLRFEEAIDILRANPDRAMELKQNINSKGFQRLIDATVVPLAAAALLTAAISSDTASGGAPQAIEIVNSKTHSDDDCTINVARRVGDARRLMHIDDWERLCRQAKSVNETTGLSTTMKAVKSK